MTIDELVENFQLFDDWEDRYAYLMDLGKKMPAMEEADKSKTIGSKDVRQRSGLKPMWNNPILKLSPLLLTVIHKSSKDWYPCYE
jgi:hypothetical protein